MFKKVIIPIGVAAMLVLLFIAAKPQGMTHLQSLWIGTISDTAGTQPGDNDLHVTGVLTVGASNLTENKRIAVPIGSVFVDGGNDIDDASTPNITTVDNVGAILYDDSGETTGVQFPWAPSANYVSGMQLEVVMSSDVADGTTQYLDWSVFVQDNDGAFATASAQTGVAGTSATLDASNEVVTLTLNTTADALITAGSSVVTIELWSSGASGSLGTTEIKNITIIEPL